MSQESLYKAFNLLESDELYDSLEFVGERNETLISKAEKELGLKFPTEYREFLKCLGAGSVGSSEIYGVISDDFVNSCVPDMVWCTLKDRKKGLPNNLIRIGNDELGSPHIKVSDNSDESTVIAYSLGFPEEAQSYEVLAESFGDYFLKQVEKEIEYLNE